MITYLDCIPCFVRQALEAARFVSNDTHLHAAVLRHTLQLAATLDLTQPPPLVGAQIHRHIRRLTHNPDPYLPAKNRFNKLALEMYLDLARLIRNAPDPFETAVRLAIAGNIIDFGVNSNLEPEHIDATINHALDAPLNTDALNWFRRAAQQSRRILYLTDNAGEIVFDRLLIEQLPSDKITAVVKAAPIINDATIEDAEICGLTDIVEVIDNGSQAPGTILEFCSPEFRSRFDAADLIIAKGQANYETLNDCRRNLVFLLKAKCPVITHHLGCAPGDIVVAVNTAELFNQSSQ